MRNTRLLSLALVAALAVAGCCKDDKPEPTEPVNPYPPEASNGLMGCTWVSDNDHYIDGAPRARTIETIVFVDENYAFYSWRYNGEHQSDDNTRSGALGYTFNGVYGTLNYAITDVNMECTYFEMAEDGQSFTRRRYDGLERVFKKVDEQPSEPIELPGEPHISFLVSENPYTVMGNTSWRCAYDTVVGSAPAIHVEDLLEFKGDSVLCYRHTRTDKEGNLLSEETGCGTYTHGYFEYGTTSIAMDNAPGEAMLGMFTRIGNELEWRPSRHDRTYAYTKQ